MRTTLHKAGLLLLFTCLTTLSRSQPLSWGSSFSPAWSNGSINGNAPNMGQGLTIATAVSLSGGAFTASSGNTTPTVLGSNVLVAGSSSRLNLSPNFTSSTDYLTTVIIFSKLNSHVSFRIADIDKQNANSNSYYDRVTITGSDGINTYYPTLTKYDATTDPNFLIINGNVAHANTTNGQGGKTNSNAGDQRGTINVDFGTTLLLSITIRFDNAAGVQSNPGTQTLGIGEISFIQPALPVKLISFSGSQQNNDVLLKWSTAQELNSKNFDLQRCEPGKSWETIASIDAKGNSHSIIDYSYADIRPLAPILFYRLKQIDLDGQYEYSPVVRIDNRNSFLAVNSSPNPFASSLTISLHASSDQAVYIFIADMMGRRLRAFNHRLTRGNNSFSITELDELKPGIYSLTIMGQEKNILGHCRLIKK